MVARRLRIGDVGPTEADFGISAFAENPPPFPGRLAAFPHFSQNYFCVQVFENFIFERKSLHTSHFQKKTKTELLPTVGRNFFKSMI